MNFQVAVISVLVGQLAKYRENYAGEEAECFHLYFLRRKRALNEWRLRAARLPRTIQESNPLPD